MLKCFKYKIFVMFKDKVYWEKYFITEINAIFPLQETLHYFTRYF